MAVAGIIAEYNPFHHGHAWQIGAIRRALGADTAVVVAMSGNFVQRGEFALVSKRARAEMAVLGGADLVLELPTPWAAATAECFARGGVSLLEATGVVTHLAFGSEAGELAPLQRSAAALESDAYHLRVKEHLASGVTYAAARALAAAEQAELDTHCLRMPNNNLAVEYLRQLARCGSSMEPITFPRVGAAHDSGLLEAISSASAIRRQILSGERWEELVPETTADILRREIALGRGPVTMSRCERAILSALRMMEEESFRIYDGGGEGLYHRFYNAVQSETSVEGILAAVKTKRYTMARLRRMLLHSYLRMPQAGSEETVPYIRVLAAGERGRTILKNMRKSALLPVITQPGETRKLGGRVDEAFAREARRTDLYTLACPDLRHALPGSEYSAGPVIL